MNNQIHYKVWDEITYSFLNCNGAAVEVLEWISNFISHFIWNVIIIHSGLKLNHVSKRGPWCFHAEYRINSSRNIRFNNYTT